MAGVTRKEIDAILKRLDKVETGLQALALYGELEPPGASGASGPSVAPEKAELKPEPAKPEPKPDTKPEPKPDGVTADGVKLIAPAVTVKVNAYRLTAQVEVTKTVKTKFLQLAVRGPSAVDLSHSPDTTLEPGKPFELKGGNFGSAGEYTAWVAYSLDGEKWVDGPKTTFTLEKGPTPTGGGKVPLAGFSGLPFNSLVFRQDPGGAEDFGRWRGNAVDGLLWFTTRGSWGDFRAYWDGKSAYLAQKKIIVTSMPHAPTSEGDAMNERGANNAYVNEQRDFGKWLARMGLNSPYHVIRVDWECNGNWYNWSANRSGGAPALKQAIANFVTNVRAGGATDVRFDLCFNKGPSQAGADYAIFPGAEFIDVIAVDQYDMWGPAFNDGQWQNEINKKPALANLAAFATKNGIQWALDEGGNTHGDSNQGGDNPFYYQALFKFAAENAANCAWVNTYDHAGAPATLRHDFGSNPNSANVYKQLFGKK